MAGLRDLDLPVGDLQPEEAGDLENLLFEDTFLPALNDKLLGFEDIWAILLVVFDLVWILADFCNDSNARFGWELSTLTTSTI